MREVPSLVPVLTNSLNRMGASIASLGSGFRFGVGVTLVGATSIFGSGEKLAHAEDQGAKDVTPAESIPLPLEKKQYSTTEEFENGSEVEASIIAVTEALEQANSTDYVERAKGMATLKHELREFKKKYGYYPKALQQLILANGDDMDDQDDVNKRVATSVMNEPLPKRYLSQKRTIADHFAMLESDQLQFKLSPELEDAARKIEYTPGQWITKMELLAELCNVLDATIDANKIIPRGDKKDRIAASGSFLAHKKQGINPNTFIYNIHQDRALGDLLVLNSAEGVEGVVQISSNKHEWDIPFFQRISCTSPTARQAKSEEPGVLRIEVAMSNQKKEVRCGIPGVAMIGTQTLHISKYESNGKWFMHITGMIHDKQWKDMKFKEARTAFDLATTNEYTCLDGSGESFEHFKDTQQINQTQVTTTIFMNQEPHSVAIRGADNFRPETVEFHGLD